MRVILLKEVRGLGRAGDVRDVTDGYARNFLIPGGLAALPTKHVLSVHQAKRTKQAKSRKLAAGSKKALAGRINGKVFEITVKADGKGTLYARLDAKTIAAELNKQKFKIEPEEVRLPGPVKKTGEHEVGLDLAGEKATVNVKVKGVE